MRTLIVAFFCAQALSLAAFANSDVACLNNDCLHNGWTLNDMVNGTFFVSCNSNDCNQNGWSSSIRGINNEQVRCKKGGCFEAGWFSYNPSNGQLAAEVTCTTTVESSDCLVNGWTINITGKGTTRITCAQGDCRTYGWDVGYPAQPLARCKQGGCFVTGWTNYN